MQVKTRSARNQDKPAHVASRRAYYDELAARIRIPGIVSVERDTQFDDEKVRSAGIRLSYTPCTAVLAGVKDGILLELSFDDTAPNRSVVISSWALDVAMNRGVDVFDSRIDVFRHEAGSSDSCRPVAVAHKAAPQSGSDESFPRRA